MNKHFTNKEITLLHGFTLKLHEYYLKTIINDVSNFIECSNNIAQLIAYQLIVGKYQESAHNLMQQVQERLNVVKREISELIEMDEEFAKQKSGQTSSSRDD